MSPLKAGERQGWFSSPPHKCQWAKLIAAHIIWHPANTTSTPLAAKADRNVLNTCHIPWLVLTELFGMEMWGGMELWEGNRTRGQSIISLLVILGWEPETGKCVSVTLLVLPVMQIKRKIIIRSQLNAFMALLKPISFPGSTQTHTASECMQPQHRLQAQHTPELSARPG